LLLQQIRLWKFHLGRVLVLHHGWDLRHLDLLQRNEEAPLSLTDIARNTKKILNSNSPHMFTGLGIAGVLTTTYLTGRASFKAARIIDNDERRGGVSDDWRVNAKRRSKLVWKLYVPPAISAVATIGCIYGVSRITTRRATAAAAAYALAEKGFEEYKDKVAEEFGVSKAGKVEDKIAQDKVDKTSGESSELVVIHQGTVLICELYTGRYFRSDREHMNRIENEINERILRDRYVTLTEFYDLIGLPETSDSDFIGWEGKELKLGWTTTETKDHEPCLAFRYSYTTPLD
jgi:hypothetical protein